MRTDKKVGKNNILVNFTDDINNMYIRKSGNDYRYDFKKLISIENDTIHIQDQVAKDFGLRMEIPFLDEIQTEIEAYAQAATNEKQKIAFESCLRLIQHHCGIEAELKEVEDEMELE